MLGAHYSEECMDELLDKMDEFLESHSISVFLELVTVAIERKCNASLKKRESKWISEGHKKDRFCKLCGHDEPYKNAEEGAKIFNYCPHCGAKMTN